MTHKLYLDNEFVQEDVIKDNLILDGTEDPSCVDFLVAARVGINSEEGEYANRRMDEVIGNNTLEEVMEDGSLNTKYPIDFYD